MSIRLAWRNVNAALADSIVIYRATAPIPADTLPAPLVTLAASATSYDDATAVRGTVYYYRIAAVKGSDFILTDNQAHGYFPDSGPGPQKLLRGDWNSGFFGRLTTDEFLTVADARTLCGVATGTVPAESLLTHWYKFIFNGKILFAPCISLGGSLSWVNLYSLGLMYGTDDNGAVPAGTGGGPFTVNQKKQVAVKGYNFLVRQPKASPLPTTTLITTAAQMLGGEWFETMARVSISSARPDARGRYDDIAGSGYLQARSQHLGTTAAAVMVGGTVSDADGQIATGSGGSSTASWFPFFELIY